MVRQSPHKFFCMDFHVRTATSVHAKVLITNLIREEKQNFILFCRYHLVV